MRRVQEQAQVEPGTLPGDVDTPLGRAGHFLTVLPRMGYDMERAAIEAEGPEKLRRILGVGSMALLGAGAKRPPSSTKPSVTPRVSEGAGRSDVRARPPVPEELTLVDEFVQPAETPRSLAQKGFMGTGPESMTPEAVARTRILGEPEGAAYSRRIDELRLEPSEEVVSAPPERNPLSQLDDAIAKDRADVEALEAELAARRAPDALRELSEEQLAEYARQQGVDPALARTPASEESAAAPLSRAETAGPEAVRRIIEREKLEERRKQATPVPLERRGQRPAGPEDLDIYEERRARGAEREMVRDPDKLTGLRYKAPPEVVGEIRPSKPGYEVGVTEDGAFALYHDGKVVARAESRALAPEQVDAAIKQWTYRGEIPEFMRRELDIEPPQVELAERLPEERGRTERTAQEMTPEEQRAAMAKPFEPERPNVSALDARLEAQRAERARLEERVQNVPLEQRPQYRNLTQREESAARKKLPSRKEYAAEQRHLRAVIRAQERTLREFPETDTRPISVLRRAQALTELRKAEARLEEVDALRRGTPFKGKPPSGEGEAELGLPPTKPLGEEGFLGLKSRVRPAAPPTAAERALDAKIGVGKIAEPVALRAKWEQLVQNFTQSASAARTAERIATKASKKLPITQRPGLWMKAALDSPKRIAGALFGEGPGYFDDFGVWRQLDAPGLDRILDPIKGNVAQLQAVRRLMIAERAPEYAAQGLKTGIDPVAAAEIVAKATPRQLKVAAELRNWLNQTLEGAVRSGALSRDLFNVWQERYPHYVSYEVVFEGEGGVPKRGGGLGSTVRPPARIAKGSELPKLDPFESIPDQGARWIRYTDIHRAVSSTLELLTEQRDVLGDMAVKLDSKPVVPAQTVSQIGELLNDRALRLEGDQVRIYNAKSNAIETWKLDPIIADGLRALGSKEHNFMTELLAAGKKGVQFGVTSGPIWGAVFGVVNFIRDNLGRPSISGATKYPFQGAFSTLFKPSALDLKLYEAMGGGFGITQESAGALTHLRRSIPGRSRLRATQRERQTLAKRLTGTTPTAVRVMRSIPEALQAMSKVFEEASRGAEFREQKKLGLSDLEAYINSQEVLGNFAERPTAGWVRWLMHVTPFLNPRVQGTRAAYEAVRFRPKSSIAKWTYTVAAPALALYAINYNDDEIQELRTGPGGYNSIFIRPSNLHPSLPNDIIIRVPSPFLPGAGGHVLEHGWDLLRGRDPDGFERALRDVGNELFESSINPLVGVPIALSRNRAIGTGVPIVPRDQEGRLPEEQVGARPSFALKTASEALPQGARFSPAKAHYALGQLFGTTGREAPNLADRFAFSDRLPASRGYADNPLFSRFFARYPSTAVGSVRDVYDETREGQQLIETIEGLAREGKVEDLERVLDEREGKLVESYLGAEYARALSQLTNAASYFEFAPGMPPEERKANRDEMLRLVIELAKDFHTDLHTQRGLRNAP
ncbi:MAG: hypothetical protein L0Z53_06745 [Acidobacteriales bacterium]|nr:hypothetical protein [Terriglobales bacterium]